MNRTLHLKNKISFYSLPVFCLQFHILNATSFSSDYRYQIVATVALLYYIYSIYPGRVG